MAHRGRPLDSVSVSLFSCRSRRSTTNGDKLLHPPLGIGLQGLLRNRRRLRRRRRRRRMGQRCSRRSSIPCRFAVLCGSRRAINGRGRVGLRLLVLHAQLRRPNASASPRTAAVLPGPGQPFPVAHGGGPWGLHGLLWTGLGSEAAPNGGRR